MRRCLKAAPIAPHGEEMDGPLAGVAEKLRRPGMSELRRRLILFARYPIAGRAKTRLIPALGAEGAAALHRRLVLRALRTAQEGCLAVLADFEVHFDGGTERAMSHWLGDNAHFFRRQ